MGDAFFFPWRDAHEQTISTETIPITRKPAPIPTIRIKLGCFPLFEVTGAAGDEGLSGYTSAGDGAIEGAVNRQKVLDKFQKMLQNEWKN